MVVRNHEGGTCSGAWQRRCRRELAPRSGRSLGMSEEGRTRISREGGVAERWHQRSRERFEVEAKAMRAVTHLDFGQGRLSNRETLGDPAGNGRRSRRERGRLNDLLLIRRLE